MIRTFAVVAVAWIIGCSGKPAPKPEGINTPVTLPDFGPARVIQPGVKFQEATIQRGAVPMKVWYYEPEKAEKLALVLVPPAGSTLADGMDLTDGDRQEHFPYVHAGFAVASFEIDGHHPDEKQAARLFKDSQAGLANAKVALDMILKKVPNIDPQRVYIAGHSSAATLALLAASQDPRIQACAAYAPVTDVEVRLAPALASLDRAVPGFRDFIRFSSPKSHVDELKCPVFLFHARDDSNVPVQQTIAFADTLKRTNTNVTLVLADRGDHSASMMQEGMPKGIEWLKKLPTAK